MSRIPKRFRVSGREWLALIPDPSSMLLLLKEATLQLDTLGEKDRHLLKERKFDKLSKDSSLFQSDDYLVCYLCDSSMLG